MFIFFYHFSKRLLLVLMVVCAGWVGLGRAAQSAFPPILYGETSSLQLYTTSIGCQSLWAACSRSSRFLLDGLYSFPVADWSPDGQSIAVHMNDGWLIYPTECLLVLQTCQPFHLRDALQDVRLAWGPDGTTIAYYTTSQNVTTTIQTRGCWQQDSPCLQNSFTLGQFSLLTEPAWSADGSRMAFADYLQNGLIWLDTACFDKPEGCAADLHTVEVGANRIVWPSLSADGSEALVMMDTNSNNNNTGLQLFRVELDTGTVQQITARPGTASFPDWSADGRYILFSGFAQAHDSDLQIYLMDLERSISLPIVHHLGRDVAFGNWGHSP